MNENKKELILWGIILAIVILFIVFMPQIEGLLAGRYHIRKKKPSKEVAEKIKYPQYTECTLAGTLDPDKQATISKRVKFTYSDSGTVETIVLTTNSTYKDDATYNKYKVEKPNDRIGVATQITFEDTSKTVSKKEVMTIKEMNDLTEYPTGYTNLKKYLSQNQYVCTEKA